MSLAISNKLKNVVKIVLKNSSYSTKISFIHGMKNIN